MKNYQKHRLEYRQLLGAKGVPGLQSQTSRNEDAAAFYWWKEGHTLDTISIETHISPCDKYGLEHFARDNPQLFLEMCGHLAPRDSEIMLCFAVLQKRPTDLSILFGKAGHRAEEDLHKAAHKLAGLIEFGPLPEPEKIGSILGRQNLVAFGRSSMAFALWQYARCRDFREMSRLLGQRGLRQQMLRTFKKLHAAEGREEGLLAGWILWLVDGSKPEGKGWRERRKIGREYKLGPTVFRTFGAKTENLNPRATGRGGQRQRPDTVKITRKMKFLLRGING